MSSHNNNILQTMEFDKAIYNKQNIETGISDFARIANITISDGGNNWIISLSSLDETESSLKIINEFGNYILGREINK